MTPPRSAEASAAFRDRILVGDACETLLGIPAGIADTCVTSPPYWGLRDYGVPGQLGLEPTLGEYLARMVEVFREVRRVLKDSGTLWLNVGDAYDSGTAAIRRSSKKAGKHGYWANPLINRRVQAGLGAKQMIGLPWRLAFALQADGWILRSDVIWAKPNPMPESVTDRPTRAHEYLFLFSKRPRYYFDQHAIREPVTGNAHARGRGVTPKSALPRSGVRANASFHAAVNELVTSRNARSVWTTTSRPQPAYRSGNRERRLQVPTRINDHRGSSIPWEDKGNGRNCRSVWWIGTQPYRGAHFATFPEKLVEPCIRAGTSEAGCCPICGTPWRRRVRVAYTNPGNRSTNGPRSLANRRHTAGYAVRLEKQVITSGWRRSCECRPPGASAPVPCTVLDPFCGSGTTLAVARRLGRHYLGIDLNPEYVELARRRVDSIRPSRW